MILFNLMVSPNDKIWTVHKDTNATRLKGFTNWCYINYSKSHVGMNNEQQPKDWVINIIAAPNWATKLQFTVMPISNRLEDNPGGKQMHLKFGSPSTTEDNVKVIVEYWGQPFKLYLGWSTDNPSNIHSNRLFNRHDSEELECK